MGRVRGTRGTRGTRGRGLLSRDIPHPRIHKMQMYNVGSNLCPAPEMSYKAREMIDESLRSESKKHRFGSQLPLSALEIFL